MQWPLGLQVNAEEFGWRLCVNCAGAPPFGDTVQICTTPALSFIKKAIREPSGDDFSQWRGPSMPGYLRFVVYVIRRCTVPRGGRGSRVSDPSNGPSAEGIVTSSAMSAT